jgi:single-strand DNA-binding protein
MLNEATIIGNLTRDPEVRTVGAKDTELANFTVAVKTKRGTEEDTNFIDCKAWSYLAETVGRLSKGDKVFVSGQLRSESWDDKETGKKRSKLVLVADLIAGMPTAGAQAERPATGRPARTAPPAPTAAQDDIPF